MTTCPYPHFVEILYGVKPCPVEELPKVCPFCGQPITYADPLFFCEEFPNLLESLDEEDKNILLFDYINKGLYPL